MIEDDAWIRELFTGSHDGVFEDAVKVEARMAKARADEALLVAARKAVLAAPVVRTRPIGCGRCGGRGYLPSFQHIKGGECFACGGQG